MGDWRDEAELLDAMYGPQPPEDYFDWDTWLDTFDDEAADA